MTQMGLPVRVSMLADVHDRLATGRASFEDWLDCLEVCQQHESWDLAEQVAHRALEAALRRPLAKVRLTEAARAVVSGALPRWDNGPNWLDAGEAGLRQARELLTTRRDAAQHQGLREVLDEVLRDLDAMLLLITDDQAASRVKLASLLRAYSRPDLAIPLADRVLQLSAANYFALTVRAGARLDRGDLGGVDDADQANRLNSSRYTLACLSRGLRLAGRLDEAVEAALRLVEMDPTQSSAAILAAAAQAAGDTSALEQAQNLLERLGGRAVVADGADRHVRLLAAQQLLRDGQLDEALTALEALLAERSWPAATRVMEQVVRHQELRDA